MKKLYWLAAAAAFVATACTEQPTTPTPPGMSLPTAAQNIDGAPQGAAQYQLNIIGHPGEITDNTDDDWGGNGHRIHVPLWGKTKISLYEGEDFQVLDANATDGEGAFQLPPPGLDAYIIGDPGDKDVESDYSVFVRPLGKPGGWATITTCADLIDSTFGGLLNGGDYHVVENAGELGGLCSLEQVGNVLAGDLRTFRSTGKSAWSNVTAELTTIVFEVQVLEEGVVVDTIYVRVPIFDDALENEYWEYDNHGLRLLQVRFYDCSTNVETGESTCFD